MRDRDIRNAVKVALTNTNLFDDVSLTATPDINTEGASASCCGLIEPDGGELVPNWDSATVGGVIITGRLVITLSVRHQDPELRDEQAELLLNTACNSLNGQSLGGLIFPQKTRILSWSWLAATHPERKIKCLFGYEYLVAAWNGLDVSS
jgi:hypothetical protein